MPSNENKLTRGLFLWSMLFIVTAAIWIYGLYADHVRGFRALLVNFNFWTPLACGMIVWPAVLICSQGLWAKSIERIAFSSLYFIPVLIIAFIVLWTGHSHWAGWLMHKDVHHGFWLNTTFVFTRDIAGLLIIWILCFLFTRLWFNKERPVTLAAWLCFIYGIVFTIIAFDMVMALDPKWFSTLFGAYFFVSGMYAALALWTLLSIFSGQATIEQRHDFGKLIVAISLLTAYMMYSQLLPIWYEDFEHEIRFVLPRLTITQWRYISVILVATIYLGPLILLLTRWSKRSKPYLAAIAILMLISLWVERWWEVMPALGGKLIFGLSEASITLTFLSAFMICAIIFNKRDIIRTENNPGRLQKSV